MEGTHGQLCTWLADRLGCDNTDRFTNLYRFTGSHVCAVTFCADTDLTPTGEDGTDLYCIVRFPVFSYSVFYHTGGTFRSDHMVGLNDHIAVFIFNSLAGETSCDTFLKTFDLL